MMKERHPAAIVAFANALGLKDIETAAEADVSSSFVQRMEKQVARTPITDPETLKEAQQSLSAEDKAQALELLSIALLVERSNVSAEDYLGPLVNGDTPGAAELRNLHEKMRESLRYIITELSIVALPGYPSDKLYVMQLVPLLRDKLKNGPATLEPK